MNFDRKLTIAIYSDDASVRDSITSALGKRISVDFPEHNIMEFATGAAVKSYIDNKKSADIFILDGEAVPEGGMGLARQLKDEIFNCPPILVITGRAQDAWLAGWSRADGVVTHPIDPFTIATTVGNLIKNQAIAKA
ncbi:MAG: hypothetical protein KGP06_03995 [Acidobacteria bacterium]|nr:hypothetical protein [Acidobacteriota bacterium]